ncbi:MAG: hypothetical protein JW843_12065 [Candidatus Aminicenantes bacterium]|nr:hypothetical protein [Candidatus Aminicenantes bacterium]
MLVLEGYDDAACDDYGAIDMYVRKADLAKAFRDVSAFISAWVNNPFFPAGNSFFFNFAA